MFLTVKSVLGGGRGGPNSQIFLPGSVLALKTNFSGIRKPEYVDYYRYQGLYCLLHILLNTLTHADASRSE